MKLRNRSLLLPLGGLLIHVFMLCNLAAHFTWNHGPQPRLTNTPLPSGWTKKIKPVEQESANRFARALREQKKREIESKGLMFYPRRKTDNFGLDLFVRDATRTDPGGDFFQLYAGGYAARFGASIFEAPQSTPRNLLYEKIKKTIPFHPPNRYPPGFIFTVGVFLTLFSPWGAYFFWIVLHEIVLGYCIYLTYKLIPDDPVAFSFAALMWLVFLPWYLELYMGQTTFIIMAGTFSIGYHFITEQKAKTACSWWIATLLTKPLTLLYVPLFLRMKRFRFLIVGLGVPFMGTGAYFIFKPADAAVFFGWALGQKIVTSLGNDCFQNLVFHFLFSQGGVTALSLIVVTAGTVYTFRSHPFNPVKTLILWVCIYFLGYAHVWQHHQVLLLGAIISGFAATRKYRFLLPWLAATLPSPFYFFEGNWNWFREVIYLSAGTLPVILLLTILFIPSTWKLMEVSR